MKTFTGIKDIDLKIIQQLSDKEIPIVCSVNKYVSKLCEDESFWLNRLLNKSEFSIDDLRNIKGNLTYKKVYRYLYLGDYNKGILEAIQNDNVYLFKSIPINKTFDFLVDTVMDAAGYGSIEILNYIIINFNGKELLVYIYSTASEKTILWLDKMDLISYGDFIKEWIEERDENFVENDYVYKLIEKYLPKVKDSNGLMKSLGSSLFYGDLESRKKIFDLFLKYNIDIENYKSAITRAEEIVEDKNKLKKWINYINDKMK